MTLTASDVADLEGLYGSVAADDRSVATAALSVAVSLPPDGLDRLMAAVASPDNAWAALAGAREILRTGVISDPTDLVAVVALGLVCAATRLESDRRCASQRRQAADDT